MPVGLRILLTNALLFLWAVSAFGQNEDCQTAIVICSDETFSTNPMGTGINDFDNPNNDPGCLQVGANSTIVEDNVDWYYFEFREDMPPGLEIEFTIDPTDAGADYDFAIWGPDLACDSLGEPVRCSFAYPACTFCPQTGLGMGQTHISEDFEFIVQSDPTSGPSTGFVAPMVVNPGEGFFMMINNFQNTQLGFSLSWGGPAAPFLNCIANPNCPLATVDIRPDTTVCAGSSFTLNAGITNWNGGQSYFWSGEAPDTQFLSDTRVLEPELSIPLDYSGTLTYYLLVKEGACEKVDSIRIQVDPAPVPALPADTVLCPGGTLTLDAGPGFGSYAWSTSENSQAIVVSAPGKYSLTVTSTSFACDGVATIQVAEADFPDPLITGPSGFCRDSTLTLDAGAGYVSYQWSDNSAAQTLSVNTAGTYSVTVTDADNCSAADTVGVDELPVPDPLIAQDANLCQGDSAVLSVSPAFPSYTWSTGESGAAITVSAGGTYSLAVVDANGCPGFDTLVVDAFPLPLPEISGDTLACAGTTTLMGVSSFDSIFWSTGATDTTQIAVQDPGTYWVEVLDGNGCRGTDSLVYDTLPLPQVAISGPSSLCNGDSAQLDAGGGYATYQWLPDGQTTQTITADSAQTYSVIVTDSIGCANDADFSLFNFPPNQVIITVNGTGFCEGDSIALNANTPNILSYDWNTGDTTPVLVVDEGGVYTVTALDANLCTTEATVTVSEFPLPDPQVQGNFAFCPGDSSQLSVANGPFDDYLWHDGSAFNTYWADSAEQLVVTVTDDNGCTASDTAQTSLFDLSPFEIAGDTAFCIGSSSTLSVQPAGFSAYAWSTGATGPQAEVSQPGTVEVTVTDANGCRQTQSQEVGFADPAVLPSLQPGSLCPGDSLLLDPGTFVSYEWSDSSTDSVLWVLDEGTYGLTVTDAAGCVYDTAVSVSLLPGVSAEIIGPAQICVPPATPTTATLFARPSGMADYLWSNGNTAEQIEITQGGTYTVTIVNSAGCRGVASKVVEEVSIPEPQLVADSVVCAGLCATLSVVGAFDSYLWTNEATDSSIIVCSPNTYGVQIFRDGCSISLEAEVVEAPDPVPVLTPASPLCLGDPVTVSTTEEFATYLWSSGAQSPSIQVDEGGWVALTVTDSIGCRGTDSLLISEVDPPEPAILGDPFFCSGDSTVLFLDQSYEQVNWSTGAVSDTVVLFFEELVQVMVADSNGCMGQAELEIAELPFPEVEGLGDTLFCTGGSTTLRIQPANVQDINWNTGDSGASLSVDTSGEYVATVTNIFGCSVEVSFSVQEVPPPTVDAGGDGQLDCRDSTVRLGGPGQLPEDNIQFFWQGPGIDSSNAQEPFPEVDMPGLYTVFAEYPFAGCRSGMDSVWVQDLRYEPVALATASGILSCEQPVALLDGTGSTQGTGILYQWLDPLGLPIEGSNSLQLEVGAPGDYTLRVIDTTLGCVGLATVNVPADPNTPTVEAGPPQSLTCTREDVLLQGSIGHSGGAVELQWSTAEGNIVSGATELGPRVDRAGWYVLQLTRLSDGCTAVDSVQVTLDRDPPIALATASDTLDCLLQEVQLDGSASQTQGPARYEWFRLPDQTLLATGQTGWVDQPGWYRLVVTQLDNGCSASDSVEVQVGADAPGGLVLDAWPPTCLGGADGRLTALNVSGGVPPYLYSLGGGPFVSENSFSNLPAGTYLIQVQDVEGCTTSLTTTLPPGSGVTADLGPDVELKAGESYTVNLSTNLTTEQVGSTQLFVNDSLACVDCFSLTLAPESNVLVRAQVEDTAGCPGAALMRIFVDDEVNIYIPNAFSPNDDGANDRFFFFADEAVQRVASFQIFNRWGGKVFEERNFDPGATEYAWDGTQRGKPLNTGVYVYLIQLILVNGEERVVSGDVTLMR